MAYLAMLLVAILVSFALGTLAIFKTVSFYAWFFVLPAVPAGLLAALAAYHLVRRPRALPWRRVGFVFVSAIVTVLVAWVAVEVIVHGDKPKPEFVYIQGQDTYEMSAPETAAVGEVIVVAVRRKDGPWKQTRLKDVPQGPGFYTEHPPPLTSGPPAGRVEMRTDPAGAAVVNTSDSDTGELKVLVRGAEPFTMWVEVGAGKALLKSNVVTITPRAKN